MSVIYSQAQKQRYRITLELETLEDFDPHQINWEDLFELEGSERVIDSYVEDLSTPVTCPLFDSLSPWVILRGVVESVAVM